MTVTTALLTFAAGAQQFPAAPGIGLCRRVFAQPLRSNTHVCSVGISTVTCDGSGTGVVQELAQPPAATLPLDSFLMEDQGGSNTLDPTVFFAQGTAGEQLKVSYTQA
jgi:hypothetical protein